MVCAHFIASRSMVYSDNKFISISVFASFILLAIHLDFNYDEGWTYLQAPPQTWSDLIHYRNYRWANNHILNSSFFKIIQTIGLTDVFYYRLLSLLSFVLFWWANLAICKQLNLKPYLFVGLVCLAPYVGFFFLGRGYALALASLAISLRYLLKENSDSWKDNLIFISALIVGSLSVFSFIYASLAMFGIWTLRRIKQKGTLASLIIATFAYAPVVLYVFIQGQKVVQFDPNIPASNSLLKDGTISSLIGWQAGQNLPFIQIESPLFLYLRLLVIGGLGLTMLFYLKWLFLNSWKIDRAEKALTLTIACICFGLVCSNVFLDSPYPLGRGAAYLSYLGLVFLGIVLHKVPKWTRTLIIIVLITPSCYGLTSKINQACQTSIDSAIYDTGFNHFIHIGKINPSIAASVRRMKPEATFSRALSMDDYKKMSLGEHTIILNDANKEQLKLATASNLVQCQGGFWVITITTPNLEMAI